MIGKKRKAQALKESTMVEEKYTNIRLVKLAEFKIETKGATPVEVSNEVELVSTFDQIIGLKVAREDVRQAFPVSNTKKKKHPDLTPLHLFAEKLIELLKRGWENRVWNFVIYWRFYIEPSVAHCESLVRDITGLLENEELLFGLRLMPDWKNPVTRGPSAEAPEAKEFRSFYGEKSELRKFADDICETAVWTTDVDEESLQLIPCAIANHLIRTHFKIPECLNLKTSIPMDLTNRITIFERMTQAYDKLTQSLRTLKDLPLIVVNVQCMSAYYRKTEPFPPPIEMPTKDKNCTLNGSFLQLRQNYHSQLVYNPSVEVLITLEQSGRWGDNLNTIAKLKTAFYMELAKALKAHNYNAFPLESKLVVISDSVVFSLSIFHIREVAILKKHEETGNKTMIPKNIDSKTLEKQFVHMPHMFSQLYSISQRFPAFGETCQLARRWLSSHLLCDCFEDIALELLVAKVFLDRDVSEHSPPMTPFSGFVKFLNLIAHHNFVQEPIIVDSNATLSAERKDTLLKQFARMRLVLPPITIITPEDELGSRYTRSKPEAIILKRIVSLADLGIKAIGRHVIGVQELDYTTLFKPDTSIYDMVIHLLHHQVARRSTKAEKNEKISTITPILDYDPVAKLVADLRNSYDSVALFFYDKYGGSTIGVMLRPTFLKNRPVKISNCQLRVKTHEELKPDIQALVEDWRIMGKRLIREIVLRK